MWCPFKVVPSPESAIPPSRASWFPSAPHPLPFLTGPVALTFGTEGSLLSLLYCYRDLMAGVLWGCLQPAHQFLISCCPGPSLSSPGSSMNNACWRNAYKHWMEGTQVFYHNGGLKFCLCLTISGSYQKMKIWYGQQGILQAASLWGAENKVTCRPAAFPSLWVLSTPRNSLHN